MRVVQELLGHATVTTTQVYTLVTVESLREVYAQAHPGRADPARRHGGGAEWSEDRVPPDTAPAPGGRRRQRCGSSRCSGPS